MTDPLPRDRLVLERLRLALPRGHAKEMQADGGVRVCVHPRDPRRGLAHADAELLLELACQCRARILAGLDLAPGKLPVAWIRLALRALREEELAGPFDDRRGDLGDLRHFLLPPWRPTWSRANCQATRPLREPRSSAKRSAAFRTASSAL